MSNRAKIAVFASGEGTNFEAIVSACERGELSAEVVLVVCDKPNANVVGRANEHNVECFAFSPKEYASKEHYEEEIVRRLDEKGVELVCLAGYMRIVGKTLLDSYAGRIINLHPSLLPAFRGAKAVEQALEYGVRSLVLRYIMLMRVWTEDALSPKELLSITEIVPRRYTK